MADSPASGVAHKQPDEAKKRKRFIPLENNPEVMSALAHRLGLSKSLSFHDVLSMDDPDLLAFVPRPAHALLLVFPVSKSYENFRRTEDADKSEYSGFGPDEEVLWYRQTIGNACGLISVLHSLSNGPVRDHIDAESNLQKLISDAIPLKPAERADLLHESEALESAHQSAATAGDTAAPSAQASIDLHFVCFTKSRANRLWELDGRRKGPIDRGLLSADEDLLSAKALELGVKSFLKREEAAGGGDMRFSLVALGPNFD